MYFENVPKEEVKKIYKKLAFELHPDRGGSEAAMAELNAEYEAIMKGEKNENAKEYESIIQTLLKIDGIELEICGCWIWIVSDRTHKEELKAAGCRWAAKKKRWYWKPEGQKFGKHRAKSMDEIREKYGSEKVTGRRVIA